MKTLRFILSIAAFMLSTTLYVRASDFKPDFSDDSLRENISSYLRDSFQQWSEQASSTDLEDVDKNYMEFLRNSGIEDYLIDKLSKNNELVERLFDGIKAEYTTEETASICREILKVIDTYQTSTYIGYEFLRITITGDYPLRVENVFDKVLNKYASTKPSAIPTDFNNTLQTALLEEVKSGLPMGPIYGRCRLEIDFNTITGDVEADFYNGGYGEMRTWDVSPTSILIADSGYPYDVWAGLWNAVNTELNGTYTSQSMELQNWNVLFLDLYLSGYNPYKYKLVTYILVDGNWWIKPQWERSFPVGFDLQYQIWTETGGVDYTATVAATMILPIDSDVNIDDYNAAKAVAVNYEEIKKEMNSIIGIDKEETNATVYISGNNLYIDSPYNEMVQIYDLTGKLLYTFTKPVGKMSYPVSSSGVLIVKGSRWVKKVM